MGPSRMETVAVLSFILTWLPRAWSKFKCDLCNGGKMKNPNGVLNVGGTGYSCDLVQSVADSGKISESDCPAFQRASMTTCGCEGGNWFICDMCGGLEMTIPSGTVTVDGKVLGCTQLESAALSGSFTADLCPTLQALVSVPCGCGGFFCDICNGLGMTNPSGTLTLEGQSYNCSQLEYFVLNSATEANCPDWQALASIPCGCGGSQSVVFCDICSNGGAMTNPNGTILVEGKEVSCSFLETAMSAGAFSENCPQVQNVTADPCGCPGSGTTPPTSTSGLNIDGGAFLCDICNGGEITNSSGLVTGLQGLDDVSCQELEKAALSGLTSELLCSLVQQASVEPCGCLGTSDTTAPTTMDATTPPTNDESEKYTCDICNGLNVTNRTGVLSGIPGVLDSELSCLALTDLSKTGYFSLSSCTTVQEYALTPCGCAAASYTTSPTTMNATNVPTNDGSEKNMCDICNGLDVTNRTGVLSGIPGVLDFEVNCTALMDLSKAGFFSVTSCTTVQEYALTPCGCADNGGSRRTRRLSVAVEKRFSHLRGLIQNPQLRAAN